MGAVLAQAPAAETAQALGLTEAKATFLRDLGVLVPARHALTEA